MNILSENDVLTCPYCDCEQAMPDLDVISGSVAYVECVSCGKTFSIHFDVFAIDNLLSEGEDEWQE